MIVFVHFGDRHCSRATIKLKYYHFQLENDPPNAAGSKLQARVAKDGDPSCTTAAGGVYQTLKDLNGTSPVKPKPDCIDDEATVEIRPGDTVVYWKFLKGNYPRAMILDDVTIGLSGTRKPAP